MPLRSWLSDCESGRGTEELEFVRADSQWIYTGPTTVIYNEELSYAWDAACRLERNLFSSMSLPIGVSVFLSSVFA